MSPIILYNVPGRTSSNISAETTVRLAKDFGNIVAIKEASGNLDQITEILDQSPGRFPSHFWRRQLNLTYDASWC